MPISGYFGRFLAKNLNLYWRKQKFWHLGTLFALFLDWAWQIWVKNANIWPKITKNAYFGPNLAVFGPKILILIRVSKSFGTNIMENHFGNLSALFFGQALDQVGQKCRYLAQNASFGPNLAFLGPKSNFLGAGSKNFGTLISGFQ